MSTRSEVISRVTRHVTARFGGDWRVCYLFYAGPNGKMRKVDLLVILDRSGIDWFRSRIADGIIDELDTDGSGDISWAEFEKKFTQQQ